MKHHESIAHVAQDGVKLAPPVAISGMTLAGYPISDYLVLITLIYTVLQICITVSRFYREWRKEKEDDRQEHE